MANRFELGHRAWPILMAAAKSKSTLTYEQLASALGYKTPKVARAPLWSIQDYCMERGLPPLTSIVISKRKRVPGAGFIAWTGDLKEAHKRVFAYDWNREKIPFPSGTRLTKTARKSKRVGNSQTDFSVPDVEVQANGRGPYQDKFRRHLLEIYNWRCALCDTRDERLLIASHIIPWSEEPTQRLNPRNGILMCRAHDALYEAGILRITPGLKVESAKNIDQIGTDALNFLQKHTSRKVRCSSKRLRPDQNFLEWRYIKSCSQ